MTAAERRAVQILARSLIRDLVAVGLTEREVIEVAAELVDEVADAKAARRRGQHM